MYKLIALDIDGTTLNSKRVITNRTKQTIHKALDKGVKVCLCTGRNVHNTIDIVKKLELPTPFICVDGAVMFDPQKKQIIKEKIIPKDVLKDLISEILKEHLYLEFCTYDHYLRYVKSPDLKKYLYGGSPDTVRKMFHDYFVFNARYIKNIDKVLNGKTNVNLFLFAGDIVAVEKVKNKIIEKGYDMIDIRSDLWENYIFVVAKDTTKASGCQMLCDYYGFNQDEVIGIGDQMNDIDMIKWAGMGVAMGNAHEKIKENANFITLTNDEDGVAHAIEKFIFN